MRGYKRNQHSIKIKSMKKAYYLIPVLLLFMCVDLSAQDNPLLGNWLMDTDKSVKAMADDTKARYDSLGTERKARVKSSMTGRSFQFMEGGKIKVLWKAGEQQRESVGAWELGEERGTVKITIDDKPQVFDYSFSQGVLMLKSRQATGLFSTLCFIRQ
ncbi:MAG: hypothetical protein IT213_17825 [Cytophagales bacterium]|nr:hypothetical protein [Cytophagales bacterium]